MNQVYEIEVTQCDPMGFPAQLTKHMAYTCGHCNNIVVLRPDRSRERQTCLGCGRWICEKTQICAQHCTPIYAMAKDHFEGAGKHGKFVNAIMSGVGSINEAEGLGLVNPDIPRIVV